jgi:hypothetical protein
MDEIVNFITFSLPSWLLGGAVQIRGCQESNFGCL